MTIGEAVVGLIREQYFRFTGIVFAEGIAELPISVTELTFADDEKRRAKPFHQIRDIAILDPKIAIGPHANELPIILGKRLGRQVRRVLCAGHCLFSFSLALQQIQLFQPSEQANESLAPERLER